MSAVLYNQKMGCGSSVTQVSDSVKEGFFKPAKLMEMEREGDSSVLEGRVFLFGETRTQRKILQVQMRSGTVRLVSTRVRIPVPRVTYDPVELMYEESQEIFHLGVYGLSIQPPFNSMLALAIHSDAIFLCGGRDFEGYNIKNEAFYYNIADESAKEGFQEGRTQQRLKYSENRFQKLPSMNSRRYGHTGLYIPKLKSVLVMGGMNEKDEILRSCEIYGVIGSSWKQTSSTQVARVHAHCFLFSNKVYLFGGRTNSNKLSKKIEVLDLQAHQWQTLPFKIHRGIEDALIVSSNPNQIIIIGGRTNAGPTKSVIKVDLLSQAYVWDSTLNYEYQSVKGGRTRQGVFIFGGAKSIMEAYINGEWTLKNLQHKKYAELEQIEIFSFSSQSLQVQSRKPEFAEETKFDKEELVVFGNDQYPCLLACNWNQGLVRKCSVPLACKMRSKMGVIEYDQGKFFLAGGCDWRQQKSFSSCYFFDMASGQMQETVKMNEKKHNFAITALQGYIYVFGGYSSHNKNTKKSCARFNLSIEGWDLLPTLRKPRNGCHAVPISADKIAVFGGMNAGENVAGIEIFHAGETKFDFYEPTLQLPNNILCSYTHISQSDSILILNRSETEKPEYQLTTVSLIAGSNNNISSSRTVISSQDDPIGVLQKQEESSKEEIIPNRPSGQKVIETQSTGDRGDKQNVVWIKPKLVEIGPKKLESQSSQVNPSEQKEQDEIQSSFHLEKIDLKQNEPVKLITEMSSQQEEEEKLVSSKPKYSEIHERQEALELKEQKDNQDSAIHFQIEKEVPARISDIDQLEHQAPKGPNLTLPSLLRLPEALVVQESKLISTQSIDWLAKDLSYLVAVRQHQIYFLNDSSCVKLEKSSGKTQPIRLKNTSGVSFNLLQ